MKNLRIFAIIFSLLLLVLAVGSFAWFMNLDTVGLQSDDNMSVIVGSTLEVRMHGDQEWRSNISVQNNTHMLDCSGDGVSFYSPLSLDNDDAPVGIKKLSELEGYVIDTYLDFRSVNKIDVYLGSLSSIYPTPATENEKNESPYMPGVLSGNIAGAVRVAFFEVTYDDADKPTIGDAPIFVWAPNSKYQLTFTDGVPTFTQNGERDASYTYYRGTGAGDIYTYTQDDISSGKFVIAEGDKLCTADNGGSLVNNSPKLFSFTEEGVMQEKHLLVRIWFEGTDDESSYVFNNGRVSYKLSFAGMPTKDPQPQENIDKLNELQLHKTNVDGVEGYTFGSGIDAGMFLYSLDGKDWVTLGASAQFTEGELSNGVYVRLNETAEYAIGSDIIKKQIPSA